MPENMSQYEYLTEYTNLESDPAGWIPKAHSRKATPPRYSAPTGRTLTVRTVPVSKAVKARQRREYRKAQKEIEYITALEAAGVSVPASLKKYV